MEAYLPPPDGATQADAPDDTSRKPEPIREIDPEFPEYSKILNEYPNFASAVKVLTSELDARFEEGAGELAAAKAERDRLELGFLKNLTLLSELESLVVERDSDADAEGRPSGAIRQLDAQLTHLKCTQILALSHPGSRTPDMNLGKNDSKDRSPLQCLDSNSLEGASNRMLGLKELKPSFDQRANESIRTLIPSIEKRLASQCEKISDIIAIFERPRDGGNSVGNPKPSEAAASKAAAARHRKKSEKKEKKVDLSRYLVDGGRKPKKTFGRKSRKPKRTAATKQAAAASAGLEKKETADEKEKTVVPTYKPPGPHDIDEVVQMSVEMSKVLSSSLLDEEVTYSTKLVEYFNVLNELVLQLASVVEKFYIGQVKDCKGMAVHSKVRKECLQGKLESLNNEFKARAYSRHKVVALKEIARHVTDRLRKVQVDVEKLRKEVDQYRSLDMGFGQMVSEYSEILEKIKSVEHHLKQFEE